MKVQKKNKKFLKVLLIIIFIMIMAFVGYVVFQKIQCNRFKNLLKENDATNYELIEIVNGEETKVFVRDRILLVEDGNIKTWVNSLESRRIVIDDEYKTAIVDNNDEELKVNSLNYTYINDFFENSNQVFKYLGEENNCYKIQFKEKGSKKITLLYINKKSKYVEKMIQNAGNFELVTEFKISPNSVSKDEIELPNLEGYRAYDSVNSNPTK